MVYLSVLSFTAAILYFYVGFNAFRSNRNSQLCRIFFSLTISMAIWSFGFGFVYLAANEYQYSFWNKVAAFGWCTFEALILYFTFILTDRKFIRHWYAKVLILLPSAVFLFMALFLFGPEIDTSQTVELIFYIGNFAFNFTYLSLSILMIYFWGRRSDSKLQRKQANIITLTSTISFVLNFIVQDLLPELHIADAMYIGQIISLIMLLGVNYAIMEYQFLSIPTSLITNELFNELSGLTFLVDLKGYISKANKQVYTLLNYKENEIIGSNITQIIRNRDIERYMENCEKSYSRVRFTDIDVLTKAGKPIPFNISVTPLYTRSNKLIRGLLFIGEDIRVMKMLQDEIIKHKMTNEKLQNSEKQFRQILEVAPISIMLVSKNSGLVVYLNEQAEEIFGAKGEKLIGTDISEYFIKKQDEIFMIESYLDDRKISRNEITLRKRDGTEFIGLITVIPSIYQEEEVALSCIVDMTDQKKAEETLKKNNEYINELNRELMLMNNNLVNKSIKDGLTNLYNHQYMNEILESELRDIAETRGNLCLMMIDIDHFKRVNDKFGHLVGDKVLAAVAKLIVTNTRDCDYIGRYGGEEFIAILPEVDIEEAAVIAENIRRSIVDYDYGLEELKVTISIGVTKYSGETANALINKADILLYQAKSNGRNRVER